MRARYLCTYLVLLAGALALGCGGCVDEVGGEDSVCPGPFCPDDEPEPGTNNGIDDPDPDDPNVCEGAECSCMIGPDGGFCMTGYCGVVVEPGVLETDEEFNVYETRAPGELSEELLGGRACRIDPIEGKAGARFEMLVRYDEEDIPVDFAENEVVGVHLEPQHTLAEDTTVDPTRNRIAFSVTRGGITAGATLLPRNARVGDLIGLPSLEVEDDESYIFNISQGPFLTSAFDGQRFYASNGRRVFIWNDGIPQDPVQLPDVVLGRPDLEHQIMLPTASAIGDEVHALWTDGEKLAVAEGNRILIWSAIPDEDFAPADLVLGQDSFTDWLPNRGQNRPDKSTLRSPRGMWSDGERLIVADTMNHRFLIWNDFPTVIGQPADVVLGQDEANEAIPGGGQLNAYQAWSAYFDGDRLSVASRYSCECFQVFDGIPTVDNAAPDYAVGIPSPINRVDPTTFQAGTVLSGFGADGIAFRNSTRLSIWREFPDSSRPADFTLGKPDDRIGGVVGLVSGASFSSAAGHVWSNEEKLVVGDGHRLLVWNELPTASFEAADLVIGQPSFATEIAGVDYRGIGRNTLAQPTSISTAGNVTVVADRANNRVLVLRGDNPAATDSVRILGQPDATSYAPNRWGPVTASTLRSPTGAFTDGKSVFVADSGNNRVLVWRSLPTQDGQPADLVLGQDDFFSGAQNGGNADADGDGDFDADAGSLHYPNGVFFDGRLFVADTYNHRVLVWDGLPVADGADAQAVLGQPSFSANEPNRGLGWYARDAATLARPVDVEVLSEGRIAVSDSHNNRVLIFDGIEGGVATAVIGQPDFVSNVSPNYHTGVNVGFPYPESLKKASAETLRNPWGLTWTGDSLFVADRGNHRVLEFPGVLTTNIAAINVWGQPDFETRASNEDAVSADSLDAPHGVEIGPDGHLLVTDTFNHRMLRFNGGRTATDVFGQMLFHENGINGASPAFDSLRNPGGLAIEPGGGLLWVADRTNHRVIAYDGIEPVLVLGQRSEGGAAPNAGFAEPRGWTLREPSDVWTDGHRLVVADRGNHRVLIWSSMPESMTDDADVIIGQSDPAHHLPNGGEAAKAGPATLFAPEGVYVSDAGQLFVADTGNNRVVVFEELPTTSGAAADRVICQGDFFSNLPNRGTGMVEADRCAGPTDMVVAEGGLWVADSRNNRVLRFDRGADAGSSATAVLGQVSFESRTVEPTPSAVTLADPVRVDYVGGDFYVLDRANNRLLIWDDVPTQSYMPADRVLGQDTLETNLASGRIDGLSSPSGVAVLPQDYNAATVWISDAGEDRVLVFDHVPRPF